MYQTSIEVLEDNSITKYRLKQAGIELSFAQVLHLWQTNPIFRNYFIALLADSAFNAYRWETPALSILNQDRPFEFVLINTPSFSRRPTDSRPFSPYFSQASEDSIITFENIGGDAVLIVPSPLASNHAYGHLAAFIRNGPAEQVHRLWQVVGKTVSDRLQATPLWLNTAGGGVAWLHIRLDSQPKYYQYPIYANRSC